MYWIKTNFGYSKPQPKTADLVFDALVLEVTDILKRHPCATVISVPSYYMAAYCRNTWPLPCTIWFNVLDKFEIVRPGTIVQQQ